MFNPTVACNLSLLGGGAAGRVEQRPHGGHDGKFRRGEASHGSLRADFEAAGA